jgi:hypothetical protein
VLLCLLSDSLPWVAHLPFATFIERALKNAGMFTVLCDLDRCCVHDRRFAKMILNVSPLAAHLNESLTSLRFATKVRMNHAMQTWFAPHSTPVCRSTTPPLARPRSKSAAQADTTTAISRDITYVVELLAISPRAGGAFICNRGIRRPQAQVREGTCSWSDSIILREYKNTACVVQGLTR